MNLVQVLFIGYKYFNYKMQWTTWFLIQYTSQNKAAVEELKEAARNIS